MSGSIDSRTAVRRRPEPDAGRIAASWIRAVSRSSGILVVAAIGLVGFLVLGTAFLLLDTNVYKARLEATVSGALGMEISFGSPLRIGFFPGLLVTLEDVNILGTSVGVQAPKLFGVFHSVNQDVFDQASRQQTAGAAARSCPLPWLAPVTN
jgi:hypothetical protein